LRVYADQIRFRFEFSVLRSHLLLCFFGRKIMLKKKAASPDFIPPPSTYIHKCTLYTYMNVGLARFSPSRFFGPSKCLVPTPELKSSTSCAVCVCVCICTPTYTPTRAASKIEKTKDNVSVSPSIKNNLPRQATSALHRVRIQLEFVA